MADAGSNPAHDNVVVSFLPNGIYFFVQDGDSVYDPSGEDGFERGTYTWDPETGDFSVDVISDTCGEWGMDLGSNMTITVNGNELIFDSDEGIKTADRIQD